MPMNESLAIKLLKKNLIKGSLEYGNEICIKIHQTLTQDTTGTMAYLQLEAMNIDKVNTEISVAYIDHNMLQTGFENADDHAFIKSCAKKYGIIYSKPGNGICHQLHLERFSKPSKTLLGSDSHTPTSGAMGMIAIGAGGLDVAVAMAKGFYFFKIPKILNINLTGKLKNGVSGKDVILYILSKLTVKGGVNKIIEYSGDGIKSLSLTDRATITNMGAELGASTSIFPTDENTKLFLEKQGRGEDYMELSADPDAVYDETLLIDLNEITPLIAFPHSPDNVKPIPKDEKIKIDQVMIGSCTNSSYTDLIKASKILNGNKVNENVGLVIAPGSSNIIEMLAENGALSTFIKSGARILEAGCGPCIGMGQAPRSKGKSLRTINRNFKGRSGTFDAEVYLASPETCAYSAIKGYIADPSDLTIDLSIDLPCKFSVYDNYFIYPLSDDERRKINLEKGPNIGTFPINHELKDEISGKIILKLKDNITTDDVVPSNANMLKFRSNIEKLSQYAFTTIVPDFKERCEKDNGGFILAGENYGQGSSREHAALIPLYLGIKGVIAKSFARIHKANLINSGILPLELESTQDYLSIFEMDEIKIKNLVESMDSGKVTLIVNNSLRIETNLSLSQREKDILKKGGYLNYAKSL